MVKDFFSRGPYYNAHIMRAHEYPPGVRGQSNRRKYGISGHEVSVIPGLICQGDRERGGIKKKILVRIEFVHVRPVRKRHVRLRGTLQQLQKRGTNFS